MESSSPWKDHLWIPVADPPKQKSSFTEEDLACLDDEYFEPDLEPWSDDDEDLSDYGTVASPEEIAQAAKVWRKRKGNIDLAPKCVHIMLRTEEDKEEHVKISIDLYYLIVIKSMADDMPERKEKQKEMRSANVEEGLKNLNIQDEEGKEEMVVFGL